MANNVCKAYGTCDHGTEPVKPAATSLFHTPSSISWCSTDHFSSRSWFEVFKGFLKPGVDYPSFHFLKPGVGYQWFQKPGIKEYENPLRIDKDILTRARHTIF